MRLQPRTEALLLRRSKLFNVGLPVRLSFINIRHNSRLVFRLMGNDGARCTEGNCVSPAMCRNPTIRYRNETALILCKAEVVLANVHSQEEIVL